MKDFPYSCAVAARGIELVSPLLNDWFTRWLPTDKGRYSEELQRRYGDVLGCTAEGRFFTIEIKTEERTTGNLFLETWSNRKFGMARDGWLLTMASEWLLYVFLDTQTVYVLNHPKLWEWAIEHANVYRYPERSPRNSQRNITVGHVVPLADLRSAEGVIRREYRFVDDRFVVLWPLEGQPVATA